MPVNGSCRKGYCIKKGGTYAALFYTEFVRSKYYFAVISCLVAKKTLMSLSAGIPTRKGQHSSRSYTLFFTVELFQTTCLKYKVGCQLSFTELLSASLHEYNYVISSKYTGMH